MATRPYRTLRSGGEREKIVMYYVYIIYSTKSERYYVGLSRVIEQRLLAHNRGKVRSTRPFIPWKLVYSEPFETRVQAREREKYLKSAAGRRWRKLNLGM